MANTTRPSSSNNNTKHVGRKTAATSVGPSSCGRNATTSSDSMEHHQQQQQQQRAANSNNGNDMANGLFSFHSVKRFGTGTPILLLSSTGASLTTATHENRIGRHFIVQTTGPSNQNVASNAAVNVNNTLTCINPRTSAKLKVQMAQHQQQQQQQQLSQNKMENDQLGFRVQTQDGGSNRSSSQTPIGSGFSRQHHHQHARQQQQHHGGGGDSGGGGPQHHHGHGNHHVLYHGNGFQGAVGTTRHHHTGLVTHHISPVGGILPTHVTGCGIGGSLPLNANGEPIKLPENLESLPRSDHFPNQRHRWNTNEEIAAILISFDRHSEWQSKEVKIRPKSGSMLLYSRKKVRYRRDGYCWKKRKDGKTTREDHMKLKVQGTECIYGCYVHSAILPTFHRRCYWLLQNPDIVLVHYLNVPYPDDTKMAVITPNLALWTDKKEWTKDELVSQLKPMFFSEDEPDLNNELEISTAETVDAIVSQLMEKQRIARQAALVKQLECGCPDSTCADGKTCSHPMRRITSAATSKMTGTADSNGSGGSNRAGGGANVDITSAVTGAVDGGAGGSGGRGGGTGARPPSRSESSNNQVSSTTGSSPILSAQHQSTPTTLLHHHSSPRVYTRSDRIHQSNSNATQYVHISNNSNHNSSSSNSNNTPPLVLSLSQLQNGNGGLIILNSSKAGGSVDVLGGVGADGGGGTGHGAMAVAGFVCNGRKDDNYSSGSSSKEILSMQQNMLKQEAMDTTNQSSSLSLYTNLTTIISNNSSNDNQNGKQQSHTTILNHNDGFISRQRQYQSDAARSGTPSMSSKSTNSNQDIMSDTSPHNSTFIDQQHKPSSINQQLKLSPINIKLIPTDQLHTEPHNTQQQPTAMNSQLLNHNQQHHFFNNPETLDLSQEDIQQTLSAYMPMAAMAAGDVLEVIESRGIGGNRRGGCDVLGGGSVMVIRGLGGDGSGSKIGGVAGGRQSHQIHHHQQILSPEINSMDFIDPGDEVASSPNVIDDDVFVNLDAFDMLDEFPDLEILDPVGHSALLEDQNDAHSASNPSPNNDANALIICNTTTSMSSPSIDQRQQHLHTSTTQNPTTQQHSINSDLVSDHAASNDEAIVKITDYSPEWAYPDGGVKVLVTGPWHLNRSGGYSVMFDAFPVPTTLVQSGVLRCYCPAHEAGLATLQVACDGYVISNSVIFEYKLPQKEEHTIYTLEPKVERSNDNLLKFTLLQRLEAMDERLQIKKEPVEGNDLIEDSILFSKPNLEDRLVTYCQRLTARLWRHGEELSVDWFASHRGMTLLHLAASLGYSRLVCAILHWRAENSSLLLETEVDALSQDEYGYTPLMWACVKGHTDTAVMLYKWNHTALNIPNHLGQSALECAKMNGFHMLGKSLERLENKREKANQMLLLATNTNGHSHGMTMSSHVNVIGSASGQQNNKGVEDQKRQDAKVDGKAQESGGAGEGGPGAKPSTVSSSSSGTISPAGSVTSLFSVASTSRSHDGVFLRPGAVTRLDSNAHPKYKSSLTLDLDSFTCSLSPSPSEIFHPSSSSSTKHLLSGAPNPLLSDVANSTSSSSNQQNNNNSNGRDRSCFGQRLSKRTSFDSGIHLNQSAENINPKTVRGPMAGGNTGKTSNGSGWSAGSLDKVTRFTRSMSLPLQHSTLAQEVEQSFNNHGDCIGLKKMDFALCEVMTMTECGESKRGGSPLIDVEAVSSDDEENNRINDHDVPDGDSDNMKTAGANAATTNVTAVSGDQDVRVLTLAEQIIAAIPDRIKNESEDMLLDSPSSVAMLNCNDMLSDVLMEPLFDQSSSSFESSDVFELSDYNYRYYDVATPCSSLSPAPSSCLQSPRSFPLDSPSPPPTTADFCEFFQASGGIFEKDFSNLTLSDREQRELYEAAKIIQKAYRSYKGRQQQEQNKERAAAILIQNYYRRYKQYAYFKQMTHAAMVIQNGFRSYCEHKRFKKSKEAALCIQTYYRNYKEHGNSHCTSSRDNNLISENMICTSNGSTGLKRTYSQRRQHQAARKIQQFMRQSKNKLQRERAEKEKQLDQLADVHPLQKLLFPEDNST